MMTNTRIKISHKTINNKTRLEEYTPYLFNAWIFIKNSSIEKNGIASNNFVKIRIPFKGNTNLDIPKIGDIVEFNNIINNKIESFSISTIDCNNYGINKHLYIEAH